MGLDMYLYAQKFVPSVNWNKGNSDENNSEFDTLAELINVSDLIDKSRLVNWHITLPKQPSSVL